MSSYLDYSTAGQTPNNPLPVSSPRSPTTSDLIAADGAPYNVGRIWVNTTSGVVYLYAGAGVWSTASASSIQTLTGGTGGAISPSAGNINILGTANQIASTGSGSSITMSIPTAFTAPGSITATTSLTATSGNISATNGNVVLGTAGNKIVSTSVGTTTAAGANSFGSVTLVAGTATVATTAVTANSLVRLSRQSIGATGAAALGQLSVGTISAGVSFIINAALTATATSLATTDVSIVNWEIVN